MYRLIFFVINDHFVYLSPDASKTTSLHIDFSNLVESEPQTTTTTTTNTNHHLLLTIQKLEIT